MELNNKKVFKTHESLLIPKGKIQKENKNVKTNMLENMISIYFSKCKPFLCENEKIKWWKINNHHLLNKILFYCELPDIIPTGAFLHNSYYIYGYFILGIQSLDNSYYLIYGIPGLFGIDEKPHLPNCYWNSENNAEETYGEFGYWLGKNEIAL